jgi:hypothetical protein
MEKYLYGIVMSSDGVYFRETKNTGVENMATMFIRVTQALTGDDYFEGKWDIAFDYPQGEVCDGINFCICNHEIYNVHYIKHKRTGIIVAVGCDCVEKSDEKLYKKITKELCDICENEPLDKRTKEGKESKCKRCYLFWIGRYKCLFPKHKGKTYSQLLREDPNYGIWLVNNIKDLETGIKQLIIKTKGLKFDPEANRWDL